MSRLHVVLRADAGSSTGIGHLMRSITLGEALVERDVETVLVSSSPPPALVQRAVDRGVAVTTITDPLAVRDIAEHEPDLVVVDGYHLGPLLAGLTVAGLPHGVIDDNAELPTEGASLVLNQNLHASAAMYPSRRADRRLLLGARYALLRSDVIRLAPRAAQPHASRVLVAIGGSDPLGLTGAVAAELLRGGLEVWVGVGPANPQHSGLHALAGTNDGHLHVDRGDLLEGYAWADLAVVGAGTTLWEVGYLGLPSVAVVVADNQVNGASAAAARGFVDVVDARATEAMVATVGALGARCRTLAADVERRRAMAEAGRVLFDGLGAGRAADEIIEFCRAS